MTLDIFGPTVLGDLCDYISGVTFTKSHASKSSFENSILILRSNNIDDGINFDDTLFVDQSHVSAEQHLIAGDILICMSSGSKSHVGKSALITNLSTASFGAFCGVLRPKNTEHSEYLYFYMQSEQFRQELRRLSAGSNINNLKKEHILDQKIKLPQIDQLKNDVEHIKSSFDTINSGLTNLVYAERQLELYRQSVLKDAFEGKLTADWREANPDLVEPADKLLARIEAERKSAHQAELDAWEDAVNQWEVNGKDGKKPSKPKSVKSYQDSDIKCNPQRQLPPSWTICLLGSLMVKPPKNGVYKPQSEYKDDGIPIVRIDNLKPSKIDSLDKLKKVELDSNELLQYKLTDGDLILNRVNSIEHIGKSAFINQLHSDLVFESNLMKFHPSENFISREYLSTYLNSSAGLKELRKNAKHAVNQASINQDDVANAIVILPGYAEQIEIGRIFERLELLNAHSSEQIKENIHRAKTLKQSILKQAFSGHEVLEEVK